MDVLHIATIVFSHWIWVALAIACFGIGMFGYMILAKPEDLALSALGRISGDELSLDARTVFSPTNRAGRLYAPTINRIMAGIRRFLPSVMTDYLQPRLLVADINAEPEQWLGEIIFASGFIFLVTFLASRIFTNPNGIHIPSWVMLLTFAAPLFRYMQLSLKMSKARNGVRETIPQLFTIAATVARVTNSIEGPNGLLSYMVNLVDSPAAEVLRKILIRAASTNRSVEEIMDEFAAYYKIPALQGLAANIRLSRRKGGAGLPQAIANSSIRLAEQEIDRMVNAAAVKSQFSMMAVVIFNMPGLMIMLMAPAVARFIAIFTSGGASV